VLLRRVGGLLACGRSNRLGGSSFAVPSGHCSPRYSRS